MVLKKGGAGEKKGNLKNTKKGIYSMKYLKKGTNIAKIEKKGSSRIKIQIEMGKSRNAQRKKSVYNLSQKNSTPNMVIQ